MSGVKEALRKIYGDKVEIADIKPVSGGAINESFCLCLDNEEKVFLKTNDVDKYAMFETEEFSLACLRKTEAIRIPEVYRTGIDEEQGFSYILMEYLDNKEPEEDDYRRLGKKLAEMHMKDASSFVEKGKYGFKQDNYIGSIAQKNSEYDSWIEFYRDCRMIPQFKMAEAYFDEEDHRRIGIFLASLDELLIEPDFPSLLHGDLWQGNCLITTDGQPCLIDPATYVGHNETDLAMMQLYGGFPSVLFEEYAKILPIKEGYYPVRRDIYQLYHIVNHLNIFGRRFLEDARRIIYRYS